MQNDLNISSLSLLGVNFKPSDVPRFWRKVNKSGPIPSHAPQLGECWIWTAFCNPVGYGCFSIQKRGIKAHRFSYVVAHGNIPDKMMVCHKCDNPSCVRPSHFFLGDHHDNMRDKRLKGRCAPGFQKGITLFSGERCKCSKLTEESVILARKLRGDGLTFRAIAKMFGVHNSTILKAVSGENWKCVSTPVQVLCNPKTP